MPVQSRTSTLPAWAGTPTVLAVFSAVTWLSTASLPVWADEPVPPNEAGAAADDAPEEPSEEVAAFQSVVVATREVPPFAMRNAAGEWEGISIDLLDRVKKQVEKDLKIKIAVEFREMSLDEMLDAVATGEVDLAAAAITVNFEREKRLDFTHAYHTSGLAIAVGTRQQRSGWSGVVDAVFSTTVGRLVLALLLALFVSAIAIYVVERRHNAEEFGGGWGRGVVAGLWWATVTLTTVGYGDKVPRSSIGRLIGVVWMFTGLFIVAIFTAAITTTLTVDRLRSRISGPGDLHRATVATVEGSTSVGYLQRRRIAHRTHPNVDAALESLAAGTCDAVVYDAPVLRYAVLKTFSGSAYVVPGTFERQDYGFAIPSGSPVRERINQFLLLEIGTASWREVLDGYLGSADR